MSCGAGARVRCHGRHGAHFGSGRCGIVLRLAARMRNLSTRYEVSVWLPGARCGGQAAAVVLVASPSAFGCDTGGVVMRCESNCRV